MDIPTLARHVLAQQAFSRLLGTRVGAVGPDHAELLLAIKPELLQQHGFVHGGVLSYLADNALTFAGGIALGGDGVTSEYKINYLRPAVGEELAARAKVLQVGRSQAVCRCDVVAIKGGVESLVAVAQGTISKVAGKE